MPTVAHCFFCGLCQSPLWLFTDAVVVCGCVCVCVCVPLYEFSCPWFVSQYTYIPTYMHTDRHAPLSLHVCVCVCVCTATTTPRKDSLFRVSCLGCWHLLLGYHKKQRPSKCRRLVVANGLTLLATCLYGAVHECHFQKATKRVSALWQYLWRDAYLIKSHWSINVAGSKSLASMEGPNEANH